MDQIAIEAAKLGPVIAVVMQLLKALPFAENIFGKDEKTQKKRSQSIVLLMTIAATIYIGYTNDVFHVEHWLDLVSVGTLVLGSSYTTYKGLLKKGSEYLPKGTFKV